MPVLATEVIVRISTNEGKNCSLCGDYYLGGDRFQESCQHLLEHGLKCLHVGQESAQAEGGGIWHSTVAVFGK